MSHINKTKTIKSQNKEVGFSLLELMIAMVIGLFLLAGITTTFLGSKKASLERDEYSILQDNGRVALEIMADVIEHTG
jgi:type IV pilus assembly protein PilW